jgi:hypothetical protein
LNLALKKYLYLQEKYLIGKESREGKGITEGREEGKIKKDRRYERENEIHAQHVEKGRKIGKRKKQIWEQGKEARNKRKEEDRRKTATNHKERAID